MQAATHRPYVFSALPDMNCHLDVGREPPTGPLKAAYIGMVEEPNGCGDWHMALFLLLQDNGSDVFKRVGLGESHDGGRHGRERAYLAYKDRFLRTNTRGLMLLERLQANPTWRREELRIV